MLNSENAPKPENLGAKFGDVFMTANGYVKDENGTAKVIVDIQDPCLCSSTPQVGVNTGTSSVPPQVNTGGFSQAPITVPELEVMPVFDIQSSAISQAWFGPQLAYQPPMPTAPPAYAYVNGIPIWPYTYPAGFPYPSFYQSPQANIWAGQLQEPGVLPPPELGSVLYQVEGDPMLYCVPPGGAVLYLPPQAQSGPILCQTVEQPQAPIFYVAVPQPEAGPALSQTVPQEEYCFVIFDKPQTSAIETAVLGALAKAEEAAEGEAVGSKDLSEYSYDADDSASDYSGILPYTRYSESDDSTLPEQAVEQGGEAEDEFMAMGNKDPRPSISWCPFCRGHGRWVSVYNSHGMKGPDGRITCPFLRQLTCTNCGATGDTAHTVKYCPEPQQRFSRLSYEKMYNEAHDLLYGAWRNPVCGSYN